MSRDDASGTDSNVSDLIPVTMVWDAALGSPTELQTYGGMKVSIPSARLPLPARGTLFGLRGYSRQAGDASWEWVLQGDVDPVDAFVDSLTGTGQWLVPQSRAFIKLMAQKLFSAGIPRNTIASQLPQMYQAVAAEVRAQDATPPSP